ncbi:hypothetical protein SAMN03159463_04807 [Mesorhizobium sp. NFR06]|nr:hypothetical protein SAMN03159463_04807 [Mesorhizobium sp. NFR06]
MFPSASSAERLGQVNGWFGNDLVRISPEHLTLARRLDRAHGQAALLDQPGAIARTADRFLGVRVEPADTPDRIPSLEMPANPTRKWQMLVEPVELILKLAMNPVRASVPVQIPGRMEKAGLHPALRMDQRRYKPHIHDDTHGACRRRVPLAQIRDVESRPSAASGHGRRETSGETHGHAFHRRLLRVSLVQKTPRLARSIRARAVTLVPLRHQEV